jgi:hypothetical protein
MMPMSYQGFGFTAILLMVATLCISQSVKLLRDFIQKHRDKGSADYERVSKKSEDEMPSAKSLP